MSDISNHNPTPRGIALLVAIIIIGAVALLFALGAAVVNFGILDERVSAEDGDDVATLADGCAEESLLRIRRDVSFALDTQVVFTLAGGICTVVAVDLGGGQRQLTVVGTNNIATKRRRIIVATSPGTATVSSWIEIVP